MIPTIFTRRVYRQIILRETGNYSDSFSQPLVVNWRRVRQMYRIQINDLSVTDNFQINPRPMEKADWFTLLQAFQPASPASLCQWSFVYSN